MTRVRNIPVAYNAAGEKEIFLAATAALFLASGGGSVYTWRKMEATQKRQPATVSAAEAGQKLFQFLRRRLGASLPDAVLHRIIRSGEVRVDGARAAPFLRLREGQSVRIPPVAGEKTRLSLPGDAAAGSDVRVIAMTPELLALDKPGGLPVHGGTGHADSLARRVHARFAGADFLPTPVHRLDRDTSGVVLFARTYAALERMNALFAEKTLSPGGAGLRKEYLAWVRGAWEHSETFFLEDRLEKKRVPGYGERMTPSRGENGRPARALVTPLARGKGATLLHVELLTGRTHQIRAQLALRDHPVAGDGKYGGGPAGVPLLLHAWRVTLPDGQRYEALPPWTGKYAVGRLPENIGETS